MVFPCIVAALTLLTNATDVIKALRNRDFGRPFSISGQITFPSFARQSEYLLVDSSGGGITLRDWTDRPVGTFRAGEIVQAFGIITNNSFGIAFAQCQSMDITAHRPTPEPIEADAQILQSGSCDGHLVKVQGVVREVFRDEIDPWWQYITIDCNGWLTYATLLSNSDHDVSLPQIVDAEVTVIGGCNAWIDGQRRMMGRLILIASPDDIVIRRKAPDDVFDTPLLESDVSLSPTTIVTLGKRRILGKVIAIQKHGILHIVDSLGVCHTLRCDRRQSLPEYGVVIEAVGHPETDLYRINLSNAIWRPSIAKIPFNDTPDITSADRLFRDSDGQDRIDPRFHGRPIRLRGAVMDIPIEGNGQGTLTLKSGDFTISVDASAHPSVLRSLSIDCKVEVSGICIVETENWRPYSAFPHTTGITLVIRKPTDITILSRPSWWMVQWLLVVITSLLIALISIFIWNRWLNRLVTRRSRALVKEQLARAEAELKIGERTRLAIELHDSLSQNLAAVACQVAATKSAVKVNADETMENLNTAERMLLSCRTELRRCLWDLRNDALDEISMTDVIRKVLSPVLGKAKLQIRFNVSRTRLDDSTLHTVICIIRELTANAVVHGQATNVTIAGDLDDEILAFSVNENGKGFDPGTCDGPAEGHFGLAGIRERVDRLCGTFTLKSQPGNGSYTKITFRLISNDVEG